MAKIPLGGPKTTIVLDCSMYSNAMVVVQPLIFQLLVRLCSGGSTVHPES